MSGIANPRSYEQFHYLGRKYGTWGRTGETTREAASGVVQAGGRATVGLRPPGCGGAASARADGAWGGVWERGAGGWVAGRGRLSN
jgi:hypothetical protein